CEVLWTSWTHWTGWMLSRVLSHMGATEADAGPGRHGCALLSRLWVGGVQIRQILEILRATGRSFHGAECMQRADLDFDPECGRHLGVRGQRGVGVVGINSRTHCMMS